MWGKTNPSRTIITSHVSEPVSLADKQIAPWGHLMALSHSSRQKFRIMCGFKNIHCFFLLASLFFFKLYQTLILFPLDSTSFKFLIFLSFNPPLVCLYFSPSLFSFLYVTALCPLLSHSFLTLHLSYRAAQLLSWFLRPSLFSQRPFKPRPSFM